jgi:roadblock/LC7 domain-containing protein
MKICPVGAGLFGADGQTDMTKLMAPIRNFANAPKMRVDMIASSWGKVTEKYEWREGSHDGEVRA